MSVHWAGKMMTIIVGISSFVIGASVLLLREVAMLSKQWIELDYID